MNKCRFFCFLILLVLLASCKSEQFLTDSLTNRYAYLKNYDAQLKDNNVHIINQKSTDSLFKVQKIKSSFHPYIIMWGVESEFKVNLNSIPIDLVNRYIKDYSEMDVLKEKLNGKRIELTIKSIPNHFNIRFSNGFILIILINATIRAGETESDLSNLIVDYKLLDQRSDATIKKGRITIENIDYPNYSEESSSTIVPFSSKEKVYNQGKVIFEKSDYTLFDNSKKTKPKNFLHNYLNYYETKLRKFSQRLVDRLIEEIEYLN